MYDLDFLTSEKPTIRQHSVYTYRSGLLRPQIYARLCAHYAAKDLLLKEVDYPTLASDALVSGLWGAQAIFIDVTDKDQTAAVLSLAQSLHAKATENHVCLFVPDELTELTKSPNWASFTRTATVIDEPAVTAQSLPKILEYLKRVNTLYDFTQLTNGSALQQAFEELLASDRTWTFPEVQATLNLFAATCITTELNQFDLMRFRTLGLLKPKENFYRLHKLLFDFLSAGRETDLTALLIDFDRRLRAGDESRPLLGQLYWVTRELLTINSTLNPKFEAPDKWTPYKVKILTDFATVGLMELWRWLILLTEHEPRFIEGNFLTALDLVGQKWRQQMRPAVGTTS